MEIITRMRKQEQQNRKIEQQSFFIQNLSKSDNKQHLEYIYNYSI